MRRSYLLDNNISAAYWHRICVEYSLTGLNTQNQEVKSPLTTFASTVFIALFIHRIWQRPVVIF